MSLVTVWAAWGQDTLEAVAEAAEALSEAEDVPEVVEKPKYWTTTLLTNINFGQSYLSQWAAGGSPFTATLAGNIDLSVNYAKDKMIWNNRLQLDYGGMYSEDKPIYQVVKDRIYFESKWGYETPIRHLSYSANFDFNTQFGNNYDYKTPATNTDAEGKAIEPTRADWANARVLKSGFFSPAYINLGVGALWTPAPWFSLNVAPISGGVVIVTNPLLRQKYGMALLDGSETDYRSCRFELGAQIKADASWVINDSFSYTTQVALFYDYLAAAKKINYEPRVTWDNKVFWKLAKFFAHTLSTNLIYDPMVTLDLKNGTQGKGVQFKEYLEFGFTYTIMHNH